jgi:hypothetical protein
MEYTKTHHVFLISFIVLLIASSIGLFSSLLIVCAYILGNQVAEKTPDHTERLAIYNGILNRVLGMKSTASELEETQRLGYTIDASEETEIKKDIQSLLIDLSPSLITILDRFTRNFVRDFVDLWYKNLNQSGQRLFQLSIHKTLLTAIVLLKSNMKEEKLNDATLSVFGLANILIVHLVTLKSGYNARENIVYTSNPVFLLKNTPCLNQA